MGTQPTPRMYTSASEWPASSPGVLYASMTTRNPRAGMPDARQRPTNRSDVQPQHPFRRSSTKLMVPGWSCGQSYLMFRPIQEEMLLTVWMSLLPFNDFAVFTRAGLSGLIVSLARRYFLTSSGMDLSLS